MPKIKHKRELGRQLKLTPEQGIRHDRKKLRNCIKLRLIKIKAP